MAIKRRRFGTVRDDSSADTQPQRQKASLGEIAEVTSAIVIALSAIVAVHQYWISRADRHIEQTFSFVERFDDDRLTKAQRDVDAISGSADDIVAVQIEQYRSAGLHEESLANLDDRLFVESVLSQSELAAQDLPKALLEITSFFGGVQICIEEGLCDKSTAHAFLDTYAFSFWQTFRPVIDHARAHDRPTYALEMERFVQASLN